MGQSLTIRILPSRSRIVAGISPTFSLSRMETSRLPSRISCRASRTQFGQRESVFRGHPSVGFVFSYDFSSGLSDHLGVKDGFWLIWLAVLKTCHSPLAAIDSPFSTYFIGACIQVSPLGRSRTGVGPVALRTAMAGQERNAGWPEQDAMLARKPPISGHFPVNGHYRPPAGRADRWLA